ncbi:hypothetical protein J6590_094218 [Homalodisca vitripennis]|nr:hypothetical protein J6590_094218 [Homalodisca vitripennis]
MQAADLLPNQPCPVSSRNVVHDRESCILAKLLIAEPREEDQLQFTRLRLLNIVRAAGLLPMETVCRLKVCYLIHRVLSLQETWYMVERLLYRGEDDDRRTRQNYQIGRRVFSYF